MSKISITKAVANHCKNCIYDPLAGGTFLQQIEGCEITHCDLYPFRPITAATKNKMKEEYLSALSKEERAKVEEERARKAEAFKRRVGK